MSDRDPNIALEVTTFRPAKEMVDLDPVTCALDLPPAEVLAPWLDWVVRFGGVAQLPFVIEGGPGLVLISDVKMLEGQINGTIVGEPAAVRAENADGRSVYIYHRRST